MNEVDDINVWVRVNVNTKSCLDGTDDFVKELKEYCPVQYRKEYYPDACEGTEIIIKFFTDTVLGSFFSNVVFSGIAFDITKFFFKKLGMWLLNSLKGIEPLTFSNLSSFLTILQLAYVM